MIYIFSINVLFLDTILKKQNHGVMMFTILEDPSMVFINMLYSVCLTYAQVYRRRF